MLYIDNLGEKRIGIKEVKNGITVRDAVEWATWKPTVGAGSITIEDMSGMHRRISASLKDLVINGVPALQAVASAPVSAPESAPALESVPTAESVPAPGGDACQIEPPVPVLPVEIINPDDPGDSSSLQQPFPVAELSVAPEMSTRKAISAALEFTGAFMWHTGEIHQAAEEEINEAEAVVNSIQ
jgi:hypothetical protein